MSKKGKVTGLGGIFFKADDPNKLKTWYEQNLGLPCDEYGHLFSWRHAEEPDKLGSTQFSVFDKNTDYLNPGKKEFMINFRVQNLEALMEQLKKDGMQVVGDIESYEYGKFGWVMDPEGNKLELWEPLDEAFNNMNEKEDETE
jgi:predicted enzyme related to lactoylglutathione lyase